MKRSNLFPAFQEFSAGKRNCNTGAPRRVTDKASADELSHDRPSDSGCVSAIANFREAFQRPDR